MAVSKWFREQVKEFYAARIQNLVLRPGECLNEQGDNYKIRKKHVESINESFLSVVFAPFFYDKTALFKNMSFVHLISYL